MKKFLLPCSCGQKLEVDSSQAGLTVPCVCGATIDVPTMRGLSQLESIDSPLPAGDAATAAAGAWGPAQGMLFLGTLLAVAGLGATLFVYSIRPRIQINVGLIRADIDQVTPEQSWAIWEELRQGLNRGPTTLSEEYDKAQRTYRRYLGFAIAPLVIGVLLLIAGAVTKPKAEPHR